MYTKLTRMFVRKKHPFETFIISYLLTYFQWSIVPQDKNMFSKQEIEEFADSISLKVTIMLAVMFGIGVISGWYLTYSGVL